jgi:hypothetical protein
MIVLGALPLAQYKQRVRLFPAELVCFLLSLGYTGKWNANL